ncbi:hypothetical protein AB0A94_28160 [Streptomyces sp. NPDC044984]|uniref:hypothetical protein n=1 Tax=Streptomyces sp. NPDC044984 TaxID=3154335 RepID=UPI0033E9B3BF
MRVNRTRHERAYVQVSNAIARHGNLSLEAVGLLVRLLSLPDGSGATVERITAQVSNGRRSVSKAMNELIEPGYVKRAKVQDPKTGRWVTITTVTDTPESVTSPTDRFPTVGTATGQAVGGSPIGSKTEEEKDTTSIPVQTAEEAVLLAPEGDEESREGEEAAFLAKINREMAREARRTLERLSLPLSDQEIARLAPKVVPWLREDYQSEEILRCLTSALPEHVDSVPALISYRLKNFTPERPVQAAPKTASAPIQREVCEVCEAPFRLPEQSGTCANCKDEMSRVTARFGVELQPSH